jgi:hypothetical protein
MGSLCYQVEIQDMAGLYAISAVNTSIPNELDGLENPQPEERENASQDSFACLIKNRKREIRAVMPNAAVLTARRVTSD